MRSEARRVADLLPRDSSAALAAPGRELLSGSSLRLELHEAATTLAAAGVGPHQSAVLVLPNGPEAALAFLAATLCGAAAPLNPGYTERELSFYLDDLAPAAVVIAEDEDGPVLRLARDRGAIVLRAATGHSPPRLDLRVEGSTSGAKRTGAPAESDVALLLHTSGTTARPKLVPLTQENVVASAHSIAASLQLTSDDRCLAMMPLFHIHGLVAALLAPLVAGGTVICTPGFYATDVLDWLRTTEATWYTGVPTMHQAIVRHANQGGMGTRDTKLRLIRSSSASLAPSVLHELESRFGVPVIEAYGMTEAAHQICSNPLPPDRRKPGSVGPPAGPQVRVMLPDGTPAPTGIAGEVEIRGESVTTGYLADSSVNEAAFHDGWFRTGDQGRLDEDGYLTLTARLKEIINRGGEKVSPREVDEALLEHPEVAQAVTFAVPDQQLGEAVAAAVVPVAGTAPDSLPLRDHVNRRLAPHKVPARILFLEELPTGPTGKIQRVGLAERLGITTLSDIPAGDVPTTTSPVVDAEIAAHVAALWQEVLEVRDVGLDDHFIDLGGDSMLATRLLGRVREELAESVDMLAFFDAESVRAQTRVIVDARKTAPDP